MFCARPVPAAAWQEHCRYPVLTLFVGWVSLVPAILPLGDYALKCSSGRLSANVQRSYPRNRGLELRCLQRQRM
jgi:hypothetical protein